MTGDLYLLFLECSRMSIIIFRRPGPNRKFWVIDDGLTVFFGTHPRFVKTFCCHESLGVVFVFHYVSLSFLLILLSPLFSSSHWCMD